MKNKGTASLNDSITLEYSREDFLYRLMEIELIDLVAAEMRISELENCTDQKGSHSYCEFKSIYDYGGGCTVEAGVLYVVYNLGLHKTINGIATKWTAAEKKGMYNWTENYHVVDWTPTSILQLVRGRVATTVNTSSLGGALLKARLKRSGFPDGVTLGNVWYSAVSTSWRASLEINEQPR